MGIEGALAEYVFRPLKMKMTTFYPREEDIFPGILPSVCGKNCAAPLPNLNAFSSAGQCYSNIPDLENFLIPFLSGYDSEIPDFLCNKSMEEIFTVKFIPGRWVPSSGICWMYDHSFEEPLFYHTGTLPGYSALVCFLPKSRHGLILAANRQLDTLSMGKKILLRLRELQKIVSPNDANDAGFSPDFSIPNDMFRMKHAESYCRLSFGESGKKLISIYNQVEISQDISFINNEKFVIMNGPNTGEIGEVKLNYRNEIESIELQFYVYHRVDLISLRNEDDYKN